MFGSNSSEKKWIKRFVSNTRRLFLSVAVAVVLRRVVAHAESRVEHEAVRTAANVNDAWRRVALDVSVRVVAVRVQVLALVDVVVAAHVTGF